MMADELPFSHAWSRPSSRWEPCRSRATHWRF